MTHTTNTTIDKTTLEYAKSAIRKTDGTEWTTNDGATWLHVNDIRFIDNDRLEKSEGYSPESLESLALEILMDGLEYLPVVQGKTAGKHNLVKGYRRVKSMTRFLEVCYVPVAVRHMDDKRASLGMLTENMMRAQLGEMETAMAIQNRVDAGFSLDELEKATGWKREKLEKRAELVNLIPAFQDMLTSYDREKDMGGAKLFTPEHATSLLAKWGADAEKQQVAYEIWVQVKKAPNIHAWRRILKDPEGFLDQLRNGNSDALSNTGPNTITGIQPKQNGTPALELNKKDRASTFFERNILEQRAEAASIMRAIEVKLVELRKTEYWPVIQELLKANQRAVAAETMANIYNIMVMRKWVTLSGAETQPQLYPEIKAGESTITYTTDKPAEKKADTKGKGKGKDAKNSKK